MKNVEFYGVVLFGEGSFEWWGEWRINDGGVGDGIEM